MKRSFTAILALASSAFAVPLTTKSPLTGITLPPSGLPPPTGLTLKHIGLGIGHQNYTCASYTSAPVSIGAAATIFDISPFLRVWPPSIVQNLLSPLAYQLSFSPAQLPQTVVPASDTVGSNADLNRTIPFLLSLISWAKQPLGVHFFVGNALPYFRLFNADPYASLETKKNASVAAPVSARAGTVDWLQLLASTTNTGDVPGGITEVYRVNTVGGKATCDGVESGQVVRVPYVAQYWYFG